MPHQPVMSGREVVRAFEHLGWKVARQHGSHVIMIGPPGAFEQNNVTLTIPEHPVVATGLLHALVRAAGVDMADFEAAAAGHHGEARERIREAERES
jgi:predicted RNA binding protein YcfA (HicA-like mRNA interferase family)